LRILTFNWHVPYLCLLARLPHQLLVVEPEIAARGVDVAQAVAAWKPGKGAGIEALGQSLADIDERIVHASCVSPEIKPLADLYVKRKENHQGEDIKQLAQANGDNYRRLNAEALALSALIGEALPDATGASASGCLSPVSMST